MFQETFTVVDEKVPEGAVAGDEPGSLGDFGHVVSHVNCEGNQSNQFEPSHLPLLLLLRLCTRPRDSDNDC